MKLKTHPEDFLVEEILAFKPKNRGEWAIYRLEKKSMTTEIARDFLAAALGIEPARIKSAGRKDRYATAIQHFGVRSGLSAPSSVEGPNWRAERVGATDDPPGSDWIDCNRFTLTVRDLSADEAPRLALALTRLASRGLPNYYDDQRLAAARAGDWVARRILRRESELALKAWFAPAAEDRAADRLRRMEFMAQWGKFKKCLDAAVTPEEKAAFAPLARDRQAFSAALNALPDEGIFLQVTAYQALLWNRLVARALAEFPAAAILTNRAGELPLPESAPSGWATLNLPLPGKNTVYPPALAAHAEALFAEEGITARQFKVDKISAAHFKSSARRAWIVPADFGFDPPGGDVVHPGRRALTARFDLPSGSYATMLIKAAAAIAGVE